MSHFLRVSRAPLTLRVVLTGAAASLLAGCSNSERLSDPWSNPFQSSASSESPAPGAPAATAAPVSPVQARPLAAPSASASAPAQPLARTAADPAQHSGQSFAGWSAQGGSPIVVAQGETAAILANRYGIPVEAIVRTNGFSSASQIQPGTRLIVPVYNAALAASSGANAAASAAPSKAAATKMAAQSKSGAPKGTPLASLAPRSLAEQAASLKSSKAPPPAAKAAAAKPAPAQAQKSGQTTAHAASAKAEKIAPAKASPLAPAAPTKPESGRLAKAEVRTEAKAQAHEAAPAPVESDTKAATLASANAKPEFRWPARGRIIEAFKPGGNDGINIAVPEGTSVKAAESGVVAYAGNELKGYGNLILIRHPNGFVSAYANTGEIEVKRGETVKRGQTIAKSGQSGNVSTPQLHFELRKGTTPVDPTQYLAGV